MNEKMIIQSSGQRYEKYRSWESLKNAPYDYENQGLNKYILSPSFSETSNPITKFMLDMYESSIIFVLKYIDELKNFKNIHKKNR